MKKLTIFGSAAILVTLAVFALNAMHTSSSSIKPNQVLTWDCDTAGFKPTSITITCADAGMFVNDIKWSKWDATGAEGTGTYNVNDCDPYCAAGKMHTAVVTVKLSKLVTYKGKHYLRTMVISTTDGATLPQSDQSSSTTDVMEFAQAMAGE
jgi:hypothetical protein